MTASIDRERKRVNIRLHGGLMLFRLLFGGIWLFVGGLGVYTLLTGGHMTVNGRPGTPEDIWLPGIFAVCGFLIVSFRYLKVVDLAAGTWNRRWGFVFLLFGKTHELGRVTAVRIVRERRRTKNGSYLVYVARLEVEGKKPVAIHENRKKEPVRKSAEQLAGLCRCPLQDTSEGGMTEREAERLNQALVEVEANPSRRPPLPVGIERKQDPGQGTQLTLPAPSVSGRLLLSLLSLGLCTGFWWFFWFDPASLRSDSSGTAIRVVFDYLPLVFIVPVLAVMTRSLSRAERVSLARGEFSVGRQKIRIAELEALRVTDRGLIAESDRTIIRFASGCSPIRRQELRNYLLYELHYNR